MGTSASIHMSLPPTLDTSSQAGSSGGRRGGFSSPILEGDDEDGEEEDVSNEAPPPPPPLRQFDSEPAPLPSSTRRSGGGGGGGGLNRAAPLASLPSLSRLRLPPPLQLDNPSSASPMAPLPADPTGIIPASALTLSGLLVPPMGATGGCKAGFEHIDYEELLLLLNHAFILRHNTSDIGETRRVK